MLHKSKKLENVTDRILLHKERTAGLMNSGQVPRPLILLRLHRQDVKMGIVIVKMRIGALRTKIVLNLILGLVWDELHTFRDAS